MNYAIYSRKLANFILSNELFFDEKHIENCYYYDHFGALITDVVLQSGLNYKTVVLPRVENLLKKYPDHKSLNNFCELIEVYSLPNLINWNHQVKVDRIFRLIEFSKRNQVQTVHELKKLLKSDNHRADFLSINGVGPKTLDYLLKLLNFDTVAVDRHIYSFVSLAGIETENYHKTKRLVEYAADFINVSRSQLDKEIWKYMSAR